MKMQRKVLVGGALLSAMLWLGGMAALGAATVLRGTLVTTPANFDFSAVIPADMDDAGNGANFTYAYADEHMLIGLTPSGETDFDAFREARMGDSFTRETEITVNGFTAREYEMPPETGVTAVYAIQMAAGANLFEIAFAPKDASATADIQATIAAFLDTVRSRRQTYETERTGEHWSVQFSDNDTGLSTILPTSFVKASHPKYDDTVVEYQNDYVVMLVFSYVSTVEQYVAEFDMNHEDFTRTDAVIHGVKVHTFEPKSEQISTDLAYVVAEGKDGSLLEFVFGPMDPSEETENWMYVNQIIANITAV